MSRLEELQARVAAMSDDEILTAIGPDADSYHEDALVVYRQEAERRGLSLDGDEPEEDDQQGPDSDEGGEEERIETAATPSSERAVRKHPDAAEFSAGDRDVECFHCGAKELLELQVGLPVVAESGVRFMPSNVLRCPNCGLLMWFGEPAP
jgi:hypothetical protein